jgi:DNA-binding MarR family transcriptional regulator
LYNRRHRRPGHIFQGRYKAILVDKDNYHSGIWGQVFNLDILKEIADYLGIHYTTVSKVIKEKIYKK